MGIDLYRKSTAKSKFVPKVNKIDLHKKSTVKSKFASRSTKSTFIRRAPQKGKQNRKENSKTEGQKANTHNHISKPSSKFLQSKSTLIVSHKNKIAFSGQTKGVRRILKLISDHCLPDVRTSLSPLWSPSHRTIKGLQDETKHRGGHLTITFVKSLPKK